MPAQETDNGLVNVQSLTKRMQKLALVEVQCGTNHIGIYIPGYGYGCRYARGYVEIEGLGIRSIKHECHLCGCFWCLPATTPPEKQICDNCHGPAIATRQPSCFPDTLMVDIFINPAKWNQNGLST